MSKRSILTLNAQFAWIKSPAAPRHILALPGELETFTVAKKPAAEKTRCELRIQPLLETEVFSSGND